MTQSDDCTLFDLNFQRYKMITLSRAWPFVNCLLLVWLPMFGKACSFKVSPPRWNMYGLPSCEYLACISFVHVSLCFFASSFFFWLLLLISLWCFHTRESIKWALNLLNMWWMRKPLGNSCLFKMPKGAKVYMIEKNTFLHAKRTFVGEPITQTWKLRKAQVVMGTYKFQSPQPLNYT